MTSLIRPSLHAALKSPAAFHEQRRSLERARVRRSSERVCLDEAVRTQVFCILRSVAFCLSSVCLRVTATPQTEDYLKRKIRSRPERSELVRMHILEGEVSPTSSHGYNLQSMLVSS